MFKKNVKNILTQIKNHIKLKLINTIYYRKDFEKLTLLKLLKLT